MKNKLVIVEGSCWKRRLTGYVWRVDKVHERGPLEIEVRLPGTGEREAMSREYLEQHFEQVQIPNYANGN